MIDIASRRVKGRAKEVRRESRDVLSILRFSRDERGARERSRPAGMGYEEPHANPKGNALIEEGARAQRLTWRPKWTRLSPQWQ
jgi:hypothetical protein